MKNNIFESYDNKELNINIKEINKAEIFEALKQYDNKIMFNKKGKEIKEQVQNVILPFIIQKISDCKFKLNYFLQNTTLPPKQPVWCRLELTEDEFPYKLYSWEETNYQEKSVNSLFKGFGDCDSDVACDTAENCCVEPCAASLEIAESRKKYNCCVEELRDLICDFKTANVLINSLEDEQDYWLNLEQLTALKFGLAAKVEE